jgi:hypothetical protein
LLVAKIASLRPQYWKYYDKTTSYLNLQNKRYLSDDVIFNYNYNTDTSFLEFLGKKKLLNNYDSYAYVPIKYLV